MGRGRASCGSPGLSGAGKSTIADLVEQMLHQLGRHTILLDGDNIRHGLNRDLGFTEEDRVENIRRIAEVAKLMVDAGLIVLVSFISPFRNERKMARDLVGPDEFIEIYVNTPIEICEARDPKGLYKLARAGKLPNLTGIGSPYEPPEDAEIVLDGASESPERLAEQNSKFLEGEEHCLICRGRSRPPDLLRGIFGTSWNRPRGQQKRNAEILIKSFRKCWRNLAPITAG